MNKQLVPEEPAATVLPTLRPSGTRQFGICCSTHIASLRGAVDRVNSSIDALGSIRPSGRESNDAPQGQYVVRKRTAHRTKQKRRDPKTAPLIQLDNYIE